MKGDGREKKSILEILIPLVLVLVIAGTGFHVLREAEEYRKAKAGYDALAEEMIVSAQASSAEVLPAEESSAEGSSTEEYPGEDLPEAETEPASSDAPQAAEQGEGSPGELPPDVPRYEIDYAGLRAKNGEFVCVAALPALGILYPVAQAPDNEKYLNRLFTGEYSPSGCIFMDRYASPDFSDLNTILFGHNMKNGTMFGSLKRFQEQPELAEDACIYVYTEQDGEEKIFLYRIFAWGTVRSDEAAVYGDADFNDPDAYDAFIRAVSPISHGQAEPGEERQRLLTLSTCFGTEHTWNYMVVGRLEREICNDPGGPGDLRGSEEEEENNQRGDG